MRRSFPLARAVSFFALFVAAASFSVAQTNSFSDAAISQISALLVEKDSRTPAQRKIDSNLLYTARMARNLPPAAGVPTLQTGIEVLAGNRVVVDIACDVTDALLERLAALGVSVINGEIGFRSLRVEVSLSDLEAVAAQPEVIFVNHMQGSITHGNAASKRPTILRSVSPALVSKLSPGFAARAAVVRSRLEAALRARAAVKAVKPNAATAVNVSEGRTTHRAAQVVTTLGYTGAGVKVGVISNGVASLPSVQASGDLGAVKVLPGQAGSGDEGTAMLEIVHDLAPGAQLFYATADPTINQFAQNIRDLRAAGCDIIVDDVAYFAESPFQRGQSASVTSTTNGGLVIEAVAAVTSAGALYFSSAGNEGNVDDATAGTWEGDFVDGGSIAAPVTGAGNFHRFASGQNYDVLTVPGNLVNMYWSDPLGASANDYDLFVLNSAGTAVVTSSTNVQSGTQDPYEECPVNPPSGSRIVIVKRTGAAGRFLRISTFRGALSVNSPGDTYGHNATPVPFGFTVAATPAAAAFGRPGSPTGPYPAPFNSTNSSETFTSDGPRRVFFNADGSSITPGNVSSTGGVLLQKPDFTAADGVSCATPGFNPFFGTSASAPHAAAIAALVKSSNPALTQAQVQAALASTAIDIELAGTDRDTGAGILDALAAVNSTGATPQAALLPGTVTLSEMSGNGNGLVEPGECGGLTVQLTNGSATVAATAVSATLSTSTPGVTVTTPTALYPDIPANGSASNATAFRFSLANTVACPVFIEFTLTISFSGAAHPTVIPFTVRAGTPPAAVSTTLDAAAPPAAAGIYTAATGVQTGRLTRNGVPSDCGTAKANPGLTAAAGARQYDSYTFTNCSSKTVCARVTLTQTAGAAAALFSSSYSAYTPATPATGYLADAGNSGNLNQPVAYAFNVAPGASFTTVVHEVNSGGGAGAAYTLSVDGMCLPCATYTGAGCASSCPAITVAPATLPSATGGVAYSQVVTPGGGVAPYSFTVTGLPPGITSTPSATSVTLSGTATASFSGTVTVSGSDSHGCPFSKAYPFTVICPPPAIPVITTAASVRPLSTGNTASVPDAGAVTYSWAASNGTITAGAGTRSITYTAGASGSVILSLTETPSAGCVTGAVAKAVLIVSGDINLDGKSDLLWRRSTGENTLWLMNGTNVTAGSTNVLPPVTDPAWQIGAVADFSGDGKPDIVWRNASTGQNVIWQMNGTVVVTLIPLPPVADLNWVIRGSGDFDADGKPDILWRHASTGQNTVWIMNGTNVVSAMALPTIPDPNWTIGGVGDLDGDGKPDIVWRNTATGENTIWIMNGLSVSSQVPLPTIFDLNWNIRSVADFSGDGAPDLCWRNDATGQNTIWTMSGTALSSQISLPAVTDLNWKLAGPR